MTNKSRAIVSFIANLMPAYQARQMDGVRCAESLDDGTIIAPLPAIDGVDDDGWVLVHWQAAADRKSEVVGDSMATVAVIRHLQLHYAGQPSERLARELEGLSAHYRFKTGGDLYLPYEKEPSGLIPVLHSALGRVGEATVIEVLKRAAGL